MRPFLRWEYLLAKATANDELLNLFPKNLENFAYIKYAGFPITIDELRAELKQPPHPDTIQALPDSRGKKFLDDANVDRDGDDVVPKFALDALPEEARPVVLQILANEGISVER